MSRLSSIFHIRDLKDFICKINSRHLATVTKEEIVIPKRINRGPTDILRALESAIKKDNSNPHFKFHDDPFLIPMSNVGKRSFAMAQESGRKAAHWVRDRHPDLFMHSEADPPIKAFLGRKVYDETNLTEEDLKEVISNAAVYDATAIYKNLKEKNIEISKDTQQSLLELLCFYNCKDSLGEEFIEERWFRQSGKGRDKNRKTWTDGGLAEEIFIGIENPDGAVYSTLIQGMAKYYQVDRAWQLFQEAQEKKLLLNIEAYNSIIRVSSFIMEGYEKRWNLITDMCNRIRLAKLRPNIDTLNSMLEALSTMGMSKYTKQYALQTLKEFKNLGIEPTLASWYFLLVIFCKERGSTSTILHDIMNEIQDKEFKINHIKDTYFFVTAMDVCRNHLHDRNLAKRLHDLLLFGNNYDLIGDSYKESVYYRHYFILLCETEPLDDFMEHIYHKLVPNIYIPEPGVMGEVLNMVSLNSAIKYLPKLWSDMKIFEMSEREMLLALISDIMVKNDPKDEELKAKFAAIAWDIYEVPEGRRDAITSKLLFTAEILSDLIIVLLRNDQFEKASVLMTKLDSDHHNVMGVPKIDAMQLYLDHCIKEKSPSKAIMCIQYCSDSGFQEVQEMAEKLNKALTLDENHLQKLSRIAGSIVLQGDKEQLVKE